MDNVVKINGYNVEINETCIACAITEMCLADVTHEYKMFWLAIDADGEVYIYEHRPTFDDEDEEWYPDHAMHHSCEYVCNVSIDDMGPASELITKINNITVADQLQD